MVRCFQGGPPGAARKEGLPPVGWVFCHRGWGPRVPAAPRSPLTQVPGAMSTEECPTLAHRPTPEGT